MKRPSSILLLSLLLAAAAALGALTHGCSAPRKLEDVRTRQLSARLALSRSEMAEERRTIASGSRDTIRVSDPEGRELILMKAVRDEATGEMVASEVIDAAVITARFRNVAERHGRIDLRFEVIVPEEMLDSRWQLRFYPDMYVLEDSIRLEPVIITGSDYRKAQLRGYELYERYLRSIITDSTAFVDWRNLEIWISRNLPELYRYKSDTTLVAEEDFHSRFGPTEADAIRHYTWQHRKYYHQRRWHERDKKFRELVKVPIETEGIRLDTVLRDIDGNFVYQYTQSLRTRPKLRKVDIVLSGDIWEGDSRLPSVTSPVSSSGGPSPTRPATWSSKGGAPRSTSPSVATARRWAVSATISSSSSGTRPTRWTPSSSPPRPPRRGPSPGTGGSPASAPQRSRVTSTASSATGGTR